MDSALCGTLSNMSVLGELHIAAKQLLPNMSSSLPIVNKVNYISPHNVFYLQPLNQSLSRFLKNKRYNRRLLTQLIPNMDLVVSYSPSDNADLAYNLSRNYNVPILTFLVGCPWDSLHNHDRILARIMAPIRFASTRYIVRNSEYVHYVTSEFLQHRYPTKGKALGCSDINLRGYSEDVLERRLHRLKNRKPKGEIVIVTTANVDVRYKGHEYVIRAMAKLKNKGGNHYRYEMIGGGNGEYLKDLCRRLGVDDKVSFLGRKDWKEVMQTLKDADIYIQPSLQEGLPRSVVEAMSTALPCIGFDTGGMPELLNPDFIVKRKDINGLVQCIERLNDVSVYQHEADRNFKVSKSYRHDKLEACIKEFYCRIRQEVEINQCV